MEKNNILNIFLDTTVHAEYTYKDKTLKWQKYVCRSNAGLSSPFLTALTTAGSVQILDIDAAKCHIH